MRELGDEGRDQKLRGAITSGESEDEDDDDWYDDEPELYRATSLEARRGEDWYFSSLPNASSS